MVNLTTLISGGITNLPQVSTGIDGLNDVEIGVTNVLDASNYLIYDGVNWINDSGDTALVLTSTLNSVLTPLARTTSGVLAPVTVGTTAPTSPNTGDLWVDTN